jgi:hypothetical protein
MTNKRVKDLVGFINVFQIYPNMFRKIGCHFQAVVVASEATQVIFVLWMYMDYDPYSVASCRGT